MENDFKLTSYSNTKKEHDIFENNKCVRNKIERTLIYWLRVSLKKDGEYRGRLDYLGRCLHLIQDSYAAGHTKRSNDSGLIIELE